MKVGALITARLKSERLPKKALRPLVGRPLISHLVDRLRLVKGKPQIVICTSTLPADEPLAQLAAREGIACYRGEPEDVLQRLRDAARAFGFGTVVSTTADNPLTDPGALSDLLDFHLRGGFDFSRCEGLPWGAFGYALDVEALERACELKATKQTEVWGGYFTQSGVFRCGTLHFDDPARHWPELRVTVDTPEDYAVVRMIFDELYRPGATFGIEEAIAFCRREREIPALNAHVRQRPAPPIQLREGAR